LSFNKYFQDELTYLRELGKEFSDANPQLAPFLGERGSDPDVERLLEGFAFMSGRLTQRLNDQVPELTHNMIEMMWPHYLRPMPSMSLIEFKPLPNALDDLRTIKRGVELDSKPVEGTACRFRTCYDVDMMPMTVSKAQLKQDVKSSKLALTFSLQSGVSLSQLKPDKIRLFINADPVIAQTLYLWVQRYLKKVSLFTVNSEVLMPANSIKPVGFGSEESLFDYSDNVFEGYRLLQDYFVLPEKFLFIDIVNLKTVKNVGNEFTVELAFDRAMDDHIRINTSMFKLHVTPVTNLFARDADPIRVDHQSMEYRIRPSGRNSSHYDIFSIDKVESRSQGMASSRIYSSAASFEHVDSKSNIVGHYQKRLKSSVVNRGFETYITFGGQKNVSEKLAKETISLELTCTNRQLPERLKAGDICIPTATSPEFVTFSNITSPTAPIYPVLGEGLQWQLISNMSLSYSTLTNPDMLRKVIAAYDFKALTDRTAERRLNLKLEGIKEIKVESGDRLIKGHPIRGLNIKMLLKESNFTSDGDMYLFASVINEFFSLYASINSYHQLTVIGEERGEHYQWPLKMSLQPIL
jgi:type VI secretion system protein ImpG